MARHAIPILAALLTASTILAAALVSDPDVTHGFPDASRRPPLRVVLKDAGSRLPQERLMAAMYLGYYRSAEASAALVALLRDRDPLVRLKALRGLWLRQDLAALEAIDRVRQDDPEGIVRDRAEMYLELLTNPFGRQKEELLEP